LISFNNVAKPVDVPRRSKVCEKLIFRDAQAPVQTANFAFSTPGIPFSEWRNSYACDEFGNSTTRKKDVDSELPHVGF
jgi:hypothetical protein